MRKISLHARRLRKDMPSAERRLWYFIRRKKLAGLRFRRQHTIGPYIADFACVAARLVIELDGDQHGRDDAPLRDKNRDAAIEKEGWTILRVWNSDVYDNIEGVLESIFDAAKNSLRCIAIEKSLDDEMNPSRPPSPLRGTSPASGGRRRVSRLNSNED